MRPNIVIITPLASSYRDDHQTLEVLRAEITVLCRQASQAATPIMLCGDDATLSALAEEFPHALRIGAADVQASDTGTMLHLDGTAGAA